MTAVVRGRAATRVAAVALAAGVLLVLVGTSPAAAHVGGPTDGTRYRSSVVAIDGDATDIAVRVVGPDELLELVSTRDDEVVVRGYQREPYLRIGPDGTFENRRSPAAWLNRDRLGRTPVPTSADPSAPPEWVRLSSSPSHRWFDHRIHWTAEETPLLPAVDADRAAPVREWRVGLVVDGEDVEVRGRLDWLPGPPAAVLTAAVALLGLALLVLLVRRHDVGAAPVLVVGAGIVTGLRIVDDVLATEVATTSATVMTIAGGVVAVGLAGLAAARWRAGHPERSATLVVAAVGVAVVAWSQVDVLVASQVVSLLPAAAARVAVLVGMAAPAVAVGVLLGTSVPAVRGWGGRVALGSATVLAAVALVAGLLTAGPETPSGTADCGSTTVVTPRLVAGAPVEPNGEPRVVGPGRAERFGISVRDADDPYSEQEQVAVLRVGAAVARHAPDDLQTASLLRDVARQLPRRLAVTPSDDVTSGTVQLLVWGLSQTCERPGPDAVAAFVRQLTARIPAVPGEPA